MEDRNIPNKIKSNIFWTTIYFNDNKKFIIHSESNSGLLVDYYKAYFESQKIFNNVILSQPQIMKVFPFRYYSIYYLAGTSSFITSLVFYWLTLSPMALFISIISILLILLTYLLFQKRIIKMDRSMISIETKFKKYGMLISDIKEISINIQSNNLVYAQFFKKNNMRLIGLCENSCEGNFINLVCAVISQNAVNEINYFGTKIGRIDFLRKFGLTTAST